MNYIHLACLQRKYWSRLLPSDTWGQVNSKSGINQFIYGVDQMELCGTGFRIDPMSVYSAYGSRPIRTGYQDQNKW